MGRPAFDDIFMELAQQLAQRSHCVKKQVGAVLTKDTRIISTGYNGPPSGTYNCDEQWPGVGCAKDAKGSCSFALHAEHNAISYAMSNQTNVAGSTLYVTLSPCLPCARIIFGAGIQKVVYAESYAAYKGLKQEDGITFLREFGVEVAQYMSANA
ncbi:MAG: dCMP deaminase family protein [Bacteroidota bacterium]